MGKNRGATFLLGAAASSWLIYDLAKLDAANGDPEAMRAAVSDKFLEALTAVGDERAVRAGVERYRAAGVTLPSIGPISRTDFEASLRAAAPSG